MSMSGESLGPYSVRPVLLLDMGLRPFYVTMNPALNPRILGIVWRALIATLAVLLFTAPARASEWFDVEGRIQYGFYTEDTRTLADLTEQLGSELDSGDELKSYYAALANYRLGLLWSGREPGRARDAVDRCVANLDRALRSRKDFPEGLALQAACLETQASMRWWTVPLSASKRNSRIERALKLAPKNPRVLMLDALETRDPQQAIAQLKKAVAAFERERQDVDRTPGWGAAEAYVYLGRTYLDSGEVIAAREAFERALVIAPEFAQARRFLSKITSG
jgi:tetratricopeptide (TPR) repeat protein